MQELRRIVLSRHKMLAYLDELEQSDDITVSFYISPGLRRAEDLFGEVIDSELIPTDLAKIVASSKTGAAIFWSLWRVLLVLPPFPIKEKYIAQGCELESLRSQLERDYKIALILVRLGAYAIGVCQGERLIVSKVGSGLIHARHKKGGWSQQRYRRHREKQIESFMSRICAHIEAEIVPKGKDLDYVVYGGSQEAIGWLKKSCPLLGKFDNRALASLLTIPKPKRTVLEQMVRSVWSSRVIEWSYPIG